MLYFAYKNPGDWELRVAHLVHLVGVVLLIQVVGMVCTVLDVDLGLVMFVERR
jgi:hypothetical protein